MHVLPNSPQKGQLVSVPSVAHLEERSFLANGSWRQMVYGVITCINLLNHPNVGKYASPMPVAHSSLTPPVPAHASNRNEHLQSCFWERWERNG